jgi:hypothetical protein
MYYFSYMQNLEPQKKHERQKENSLGGSTEWETVKGMGEFDQSILYA